MYPFPTTSRQEYDNSNHKVTASNTQTSAHLHHVRSAPKNGTVRDTRNHFSKRIRIPVIDLARISFSRARSVIATSISSGVSGRESPRSRKSRNEGIELAVTFERRSCNKATTIPCKCGNDSLYDKPPSQTQ